MTVRMTSCWVAALVMSAPTPTANAQARGAEPGIVLLVDVSGSMKTRIGNWYEIIRETADGVLDGNLPWRRHWTGFSGDSTILSAIAAIGPVQLAVVPFGIAARQSPYFDVPLEQTVDQATRRRIVDNRFPPRGSFAQGKTFVNLAQAVAIKRLGDAGVSTGYVIAFSDFEQDAAGTVDQLELIAHFTTNTLPLRQTRNFVARAILNPSIELRVIELSARVGPQVTQPRNTAPHTGPRLLRPGPTATEGTITFAWTPVAGAETYMLELTRIDARTAARQFVLSSVDKAVTNVATGSYKWTVTARAGGVRQIGAPATRQVRVRSRPSSPLGPLALGVVLLLLAGGGVWIWRRRRLQAAAH